jgi:LacI family transcriptional regulator
VSATDRSGGRVTIGDVAALAGVDKAVVSKVINADPGLNVRPETRQRVEETIAELGYSPNSSARSLRTSKTRTFGLLIPDFSNPVYAEVITGAEAAALKRGYVLMTASNTPSSSESNHYMDVFDRDRIDGLLIAGHDHDSAVLDRLTGRGVPWLLVNSTDANARRYVAVDDSGAAQLAVEHLIALGHRKIAHVAGPLDADTAERRSEGYVTAIQHAGLDLDPRLTAAGDYTADGGYAATTALIRSGLPMTAVFVANVTAATGTLHALHENGLRVPGDVSVVTLHDHALAHHLVPSLTTVRMPLRQLGARAVEVLMASRASSPVEEILPGPIDLLIRESTGLAPS